MKNNNDLEISVLRGDKLFNQNTPFIININTQKLQTATKMCNADLICVIDISGSMIGKKLDMVKKSLIILIKMMDENDRLALVLFESYAHILCNLEYMTETKKKEFISKVNLIDSGSTTNILSGLKKAVEILKNIKNNKDDKRASSILLLSDGCDNVANSSFELLNGFKNLYKGEKLDFTLNTFGYGDDHDPEIMNQLANIRDGSFFYVQDYKKVSEYFVSVLGSCVSIISKNVNVSVKLLNEHCQIAKILGEKYLYNYALEPHVFKTEIMQLLCDKEYTYVLEINLDEDKIKKDDEILYVEVLYKDMNNDNKLVKKTFMYKYESNEANKDKANEEYIRSQVYYILDEALKLREKNKNKEANDLLSNMEDWIKTNYKGNNTFYLEDIQKAKNLFVNEEIFEKKGKAFAKSNIKQKMHKKIGANDMYRNCNMDYYCKNIDDRDLEILESNNDNHNLDDSYEDNYNNYNNYKKNIRYNNLNIQEDDYTKNIDDFENNENNYYNNNENNYEYDVCNIVNNIFKNNN